MKKLILHICCAPDATAAYERLAVDWEIIGLFYNPNVEPQLEYDLREAETRYLSARLGMNYCEGSRTSDEWLNAVRGFESEPEGGGRCERCIAHRMEWTARFAKDFPADAFTTTLTVSPHKNVKFIHKIGHELGDKYGIHYLDETLRKNDGFKRSIELSKEFQLYRQDYCGCRWSMPGIREKLAGRNGKD